MLSIRKEGTTLPNPLPYGVEAFDPFTADPVGTVIFHLYGAPKTGKSHNAYRASNPRYIVYLDPNDNLNMHLTRAAADGFPVTDEEGNPTVFIKRYLPMPYELLTRDEATRRTKEIESFAMWARSQGKGGTFIVDGSTMLKGLYEKAEVGESPTLGFRPSRGKSAPNTKEYQKSNTALRNFVQGFVGSGVDLVMTWEGRAIWKTYDDGKGGTVDKKTSEYAATMPDGLGFAMGMMIETFMAIEDKNVGGQVVKVARPMMKIGANAFDMVGDAPLFGRTMGAKGIGRIRAMLAASVPELERDTVLELEPLGTEHKRAVTGLFEENPVIVPVAVADEPVDAEPAAEE